MRRLVIVTALAALGTLGTIGALGACAAGGAPEPEVRFENVEWRLVELVAYPAVPPGLQEGAHLRFVADSGRVVGSTGCNRILGHFVRKRDALHFGMTLATRTACLDPELAWQERAFLYALHATDRYDIDGETLTLYAKGQPVARLMAAAP